jgi:hypothetical protein
VIAAKPRERSSKNKGKLVMSGKDNVYYCQAQAKINSSQKLRNIKNNPASL